MKLVVPRKSFAEVFQTVAAVCPSRTPKDILKCVLFRFGNDKGQLIGSDSEIGLRCDLTEIKADQNGDALFPVDKILPILNALSGSELTMTITSGSVEIVCGSSRFKIALPDAGDFPPVAEFKETAFRTIDAASLKRAIKQTSFAYDPASTSYATNGVLFDFDDKAESLTLVATDSRRMAISQCKAGTNGTPSEISPTPVLPVKAVNLVEKMLGNSGSCDISVSPNNVIFRHDGAVLCAGQVAGRFPKWQKVIPQNKYSIAMVAGPFLDIVKQSMIVRNPESSAVEFTFGNGELKLDSKAKDIGNSTITMPISYDGPETAISLDPKYLFEFLRILDGAAHFELKIDGPETAILCSLVDYQYIVMPLFVE